MRRNFNPLYRGGMSPGSQSRPALPGLTHISTFSHNTNMDLSSPTFLTSIPTRLANAKALDKLTAGVQKSTREVQDNIRQLERLRNDVTHDTISQIKDIWMQKMQNHNDYSNPILDEIRKEVEAAKAEGKNAQPCYDTAFNTLKNIWDAASSDAQQCVDTAKLSIKRELDFIDDLISTGRTQSTELGGIFPNCSSNDISAMQRSIAVKLGAANIAGRNFEAEVNSAKLTAQSASSNIVLQGRNCISDIYSSALSQVTEVRIAATKCLQAL
jgi:hypothetical protein